MKQKSLLRSMLLLFALIVGISSAWATDFTTVFESGISSTPYSGQNLDLWNISKTGTTGYEATRGIQFQKNATGTFETKASYDNVSEVIVQVAKSSNGAGTVKIYVNNTLKKTISSFNTSLKTETLTLNTAETGKIKIEVSASASSLYIKNIKVTYTPVTKTNTTLALNPTSLNLSYGGSTGTLEATVTPEGGSALTNPTIRWEVTGTTGIASVSNGTVTPIAGGTTEITAYYDGDNSYNSSSASATVTVTDDRTPVVSAIEKICSQKTLYIGGAIAFEPIVTLAEGLSASDVTYSYVSSDPSTIRINEGGTYTVLKTGNNIDITVTVTPIAAKQSTHKPVSATFQHNGAYRYTGLTLPEGGNFSGSKEITMTIANNPQGPIYYTTNGNDPLEDETNRIAYEGAFTITATTTIKARVIDNDGLYSTMQTATYTKVPANKDAITLAAGQTLSFTDFTALGAYGTNEEEYVISSDGDNYKFKSTDVGCFSNKRMQIKDNASAYTTLSPVTAPYGFMMSVTTTQNNVDVYVGTSKQTAVNGIYYFSSGDAVTLKRNGGTTLVSNITFTGLKAPVATEVVITDPGTLAKDATGTFAYTATTEEANTASWTSATTGVITITDAATGAYTAAGRGTSKITLTLTPTDATNYRAVTAERTVTVMQPVVITASDVEMTYGDDPKAITVVATDGYAGTLTYQSNNTAVATVSADGKVTAVAKGTTTITISAPADATNYFTAGENVVINVTVKGQAGLAYATTLYTVAYGADFTTPTLTNPNNLSVTYSKTGDNVATVDASTGAVTILSGTKGTARITASFAGNDEYAPGSAYYDIKVYDPDANDGSLAKPFTVEEANAWIAENLASGETTDNNYYVRGIVSSLAVNGKALDASEEDYYGRQYFFISDDGNSETDELGVFYAKYLSNASFSLTTWLMPGDEVVVCGPLQNYDGDAPYYVETSDNTYVQSITRRTFDETTIPVEESFASSFGSFINDGTKVRKNSSSTTYNVWTIDTSNHYAKATSYVTSTNTDAESMLISGMIDGSNAIGLELSFDQSRNRFFGTIGNEAMVYAREENGSWTKQTISEYPSAPSNNDMSSFETATVDLSAFDGKKFQIAFIYKGTTTTAGTWEVKNVKINCSNVDVKIGQYKWATFCSSSALDFTDTGVTAYIVTGSEGESTITKQPVTKVPANTGLLLKAEQGTYSIPVTADETDDVSANKLVPVLTGSVTVNAGTEGNVNYVLTVQGGQAVFAWIGSTPATVTAGKAYLTLLNGPMPGSGTGAPWLSIDGDEGTTGVQNIERTINDNQYYTLDGRRVETPSKGLYIINGKKVVVK